MSGGHFDYNQYKIRTIIESIEDVMDNSEFNIENGYDYDEYRYSPETLEEFRKGIDVLKKAAVYAQRIDWLISGDDGEEAFHRRLKEELEEI